MLHHEELQLYRELVKASQGPFVSMANVREARARHELVY